MRLRQSIISLSAAILCALLVSTSATVQANERNDRNDRNERDDQSCLPGLSTAVRRNPVYAPLYAVLLFNESNLRTLLNQVSNQPSYEALLTRARALASRIPSGRVLLTLPDGTVVLDTSRADDPGNALPFGNSYAHYLEKTVNENHNTRVAILSAQLYPCGVGVERKLSTSTGTTESYVALRLGRHLDSAGTARLSIVQ